MPEDTCSGEPLTLPYLLDGASRLVLTEVADAFEVNGRWPTFSELDETLVRRYRLLDCEAILSSLLPGVVLGLWGRGVIAEDQDVALSVLALHLVRPDSESLRAFRSFLNLATEIVAHHSFGDELTISANDFVERLTLPAAGRAQLVARLGLLINGEGSLWSQFSGQGASWTVRLNRRGIRQLGIDTEDSSHGLSIEQYWNRSHVDAAQPAANPPLSALAEPNSGAPSSPWRLLLSDRMRSATDDRLDAGLRGDAILNAWRLLVADLQLLTGLDLDGVDLVNQALRRFKLFDLGGIRTSAGRDEREGYPELMRGLARVGRNLTVHGSWDQSPGEESTAALILLTDMCIRRLEGEAPPADAAPTSSEG